MVGLCPYRLIEKGVRKMALNAKAKRAAEMMVAEPEKKLEDVASELGVNPSTLWRWRQKPEFKEYEHGLCMERFKDFEKVAIAKLQQNALKGNQKAIEYVLDYLGYKPTQKLEADVTSQVIFGGEDNLED